MILLLYDFIVVVEYFIFFYVLIVGFGSFVKIMVNNDLTEIIKSPIPGLRFENEIKGAMIWGIHLVLTGCCLMMIGEWILTGNNPLLPIILP